LSSRGARVDLNVFVATDGCERTGREYQALLASAASPSGVSLIEARKR